MSGCRLLRLEALAALLFLLVIEARCADAPAAPPATRRASSWITELLAAELPKYEAHSADDSAVVSESTDEAVEHDGVLNLPKLTVRPVMKESPADHAFLTAKGRLDLAMKNHPGQRFGNLFGLNNGITLFMQWEEQRVRKINDLTDRVQRVSIDDSEETQETLRMLKAAIQRSR